MEGILLAGLGIMAAIVAGAVVLFAYEMGRKEAFCTIARNYIVFDKHTVIGAVTGDKKNEKNKPNRNGKKTSK